MQSYAHHLVSSLSSKHLLKHPFYTAWNEGRLSKKTLQTYAKQYAYHVRAFPRYLSSTHSNCENLLHRQVLLENLIEEERGPENHPELWNQFAESLGCSRPEIQEEIPMAATDNLVDTFMGLSQSSYAEGLGALFAYEHQVPEIAKSKLEGLEKFYGITKGTKFFDVHLKADVYHTQEVAQLIDELSEEDQAKVYSAAQKAASAMWKFLDQMCEFEGIPLQTCSE
ncbi:MAG: CADD family putative folate metabolism protein [Bacteriovoracia bacterium]